MKAKIELQTDYTEYGNSTGMQIDTLARAAVNFVHDEVEDFYEEDSAEAYAIEHYDYEKEFLASLEPDRAKYFLTRPKQYATQLERFTETLKEQAGGNTLDDSHPLAIEMQNARDEVNERNYKEYIYGDHQNFAGVLKEAERMLSNELNGDFSIEYDQKNDVISFELEDEDAQYVAETNGIPEEDHREDSQSWGEVAEQYTRFETALVELVQNTIENKASANYGKQERDRKERKAERERVAEYQAKREREAEEARKAKLLEIVNKK